jgi:hypothetical protein
VIGQSGNIRVMVAAKPVDFRKRSEGLAALVCETMRLDPFSGVVYVKRGAHRRNEVRNTFLSFFRRPAHRPPSRARSICMISMQRQPELRRSLRVGTHNQ